MPHKQTPSDAELTAALASLPQTPAEVRERDQRVLADGAKLVATMAAQFPLMTTKKGK